MSSSVHFKGKPSLKPTIDKEEQNLYNKPTVSVVCLLDAIVKVTGTVTNNLYVFHNGNPVNVDIRDKDEILNKKRGRACCGGNSDTPIFELV